MAKDYFLNNLLTHNHITGIKSLFIIPPEKKRRDVSTTNSFNSGKPQQKGETSSTFLTLPRYPR